MTDAIIRKYFVDLLELLPMNDAMFRGKLYSAGLFPNNLREEVQSKTTAAEKVEYFLHYGIKNNTESFNKLLTIMKDYTDDNLKKLAEMINRETGDRNPELSEIHRNIVPVYAARWKDLGVQLKIPIHHLNTIAIDNVHHPSYSQQCCKAMLQKWMESTPNPTWDELQKAIDYLSNLSQDCISETVITVGIVQNKLKTAYKHICNSDNPHCYIQLALVLDEICNIHDERLNKTTRHTLQGQVDEISKIKEPLKRGLKDIFHYNDLPCPRLILVVGAQGIGKTTLANEICLKWAKEEEYFLSNDYDLVILIQLRTVQERTLQQVMIEAIGSEAAYDELLIKSHGKRCLIILEGLDEISDDWQENDTMFCQLVKNTVFLSCANILVTSRPHACIHLYKNTSYTRIIEIVGFDKLQIEERAKLYFQNSNMAEKFMEQVNNNPHISSLCYVPLCLNMVLGCFKDNNETLHTTLTELYQSFIISKVDEHKQDMPLGIVLESDQNYIKNLTTNIPYVLSKEALETLFLLSKLAYKSYFEWYECKKDAIGHKKDNIGLFNDERNTERNPKIIYTIKELAHCNVTNSGNDACGLLKATNTLFATSNTALYTFNHLSVQEYFCALYISLLPEDKQLYLLNNHITHYPHMWPFYAGITKLRSSDVLHHICQILLRDEQLNQINFVDCNFAKKQLIFSVHQSIMVVLKSIYESQLSNVFNKRKTFSLFMMGHILYPYDCISISYFMSVTQITHLILQGCSVKDRGAEMLAKCIYKDLIPSLKVLNLSSCEITNKGMESVVVIINSSTNLTNFVAASNPIGDDGIQVFSLLRFKHLIQLNIMNVKMTEIGTCALGESFKFNNSLRSLEIGSNETIKDNGLTGILNNLPSTLVRLIVSRCNLTYDGAVSIGKMLRINETLKHLEISCNSIGDDGISAISDGLHINTTLIQLVAHSCEFYNKGAESVAKMLQANKTLEYLDISYNNIGDDGIKAVASGIQTNTTLIQLRVLNWKGAECVAEMLMVNKTLKELGITYNNDTITVLKTFCKRNCTLMQLNIAIERDDSFLMITNYIDKVNCVFTTIYNAAHCITCDGPFYVYDSEWRKECTLKKHDQSTDHTTSDNSKEWLIGHSHKEILHS